MKQSYCPGCDVTHTSIMCFSKPRKPIKPKLDLTWGQTVSKWHLANRSPTNTWTCYLQIYEHCPKTLNKKTLTLDHVIPRSRGRKYKYDINNLKPACWGCNMLKGSRSIEALARDYILDK